MTVKALLLRMLLGAIPALVMGCATTVQPHLMATPAIFKHEKIDLMKAVQEDQRTSKVSVFYATTRQPTPVGKPGHYSDKPNTDGMELGVAEVSLGEPEWTFDDLVASDRISTVDNPRPGHVESIEVIGSNIRTGMARTDAERAFVARINQHIEKLRNPEVILYVHGYRVTFDEVAVLMGSVSKYLGDGATVAFQWPTGQHFWNYLSDCPNAKKYVPDIERTIDLLSQTNAQHVNLLAYSCGSPLLAEALKNLRGRYPDEGHEELLERYRIGSVIFAASDIDLKTFALSHIPAILDVAQQTTIYMSRRDAALGFSSMVAGASRVGRPTEEDFASLKPEDIERLAAATNLHAIDVTDVRGAHEMGGMTGHGYWYANDWISTDVILSLRYPIHPENRCLAKHKKGKNMWRIPDDYIDCVADRLLKLRPELSRETEP